MGEKDADTGAELTKRSARLREYAREARTLARKLGPYVDDAVKKAAPRSGSRTGDGADAIWQGPFADECTAKLQQRQRTLDGMGGALPADAARWEYQADELDRQAKERDKAKTVTGGS